jgi:hypothetical protein
MNYKCIRNRVTTTVWAVRAVINYVNSSKLLSAGSFVNKLIYESRFSSRSCIKGNLSRDISCAGTCMKLCIRAFVNNPRWELWLIIWHHFLWKPNRLRDKLECLQYGHSFKLRTKMQNSNFLQQSIYTCNFPLISRLTQKTSN